MKSNKEYVKRQEETRLILEMQKEHTLRTICNKNIHIFIEQISILRNMSSSLGTFS